MGYRDPSPIILNDGPWSSMRDNYAPTARKPGSLALGLNTYPAASAAGGATLGRPGCKQLGTVQLGSAGARTVQGYANYEKKNGTRYTVQICGGKFYTLNWTTRVWTEVLTAAHFGAASGGAVTLSTTARVSFLVFADYLIVSDGINTMFSWDGTSGGGIIKLTNAPVAYGPLNAYNGRIFFPKAADRSTFVWSEVAQPNVGYDIMAGYANAWTLTQTDSSPINRLVGTNDAIDVFRSRSSTNVTGKVDINFQSSGTDEAIDGQVGSDSPWAFIETNRALVFLDADCQPQLLRNGGRLMPLHEDLYETIRQIPKTNLVAALAVNYTPANLYLFAVPDVSSTTANLIIVFNGEPDIPVPVALWRGWNMTAMEMLENSSANPRLVWGFNGYSYEVGGPNEDNYLNDELVTGTVAIEQNVVTQALGFDVKREMIFDRFDVSLYAASAMTVDVWYETPRGSSTVKQITITGGGAVWDVAVWDVASWAASSLEEHKSLGWNGEGRWIKVYMRHKALNERFGVNSLGITAFPANTDPKVP